MATDIERLVVQLEANMRNYDRSMQRAGLQAKRAADRVEREFANANRGLSRQFAAMGRAGQAAFAAIAAAGAGVVARELTQVADAVNQLRGRIGLYTESAEETEQVLATLFDRARDLGASFEGLAETYARIVPSQDQLNLSTQQMLDLSEAVASAFIVSGASAEEARNATLQLSQAFASGELRGEELRSVMEQGQRIMMALSRATGETTGGLREMAEQGQLTADVVANALLSELPTLRSEMEQLPVTVGRGMQSLRASFVELIANIDDTTGATRALGGILQDIAEGVDNLNQRLNETPEAKLTRLEEHARVMAERGPLLARVMNQYADALDTTVDSYGNALGSLDEGVVTMTDGLVSGIVAFTQFLSGDLGENRRAQQIAEVRAEVERLERSYMRAGLGPMWDNRLGARDAPDPASGVAPRLAPRASTGSEDALPSKPDKVSFGDVTATGGKPDKGEALAAEKRAAEEIARAQAEEYARALERRRSEFSGEFARTIAGGWMAAFDGNLADFAAQRLRDALYNRLFEVFSRLGQQLFDNMQGKGGLFASVARVAFGGGKAAGGPVRAGMAYRVGERGPETIVPMQNGMVIPNQGPMRSGGAGVVNVSSSLNIDARGATPDAVAQLRQELPQTFAANNQRLISQFRAEVPGLVVRARKDGVL